MRGVRGAPHKHEKTLIGFLVQSHITGLRTWSSLWLDPALLLADELVAQLDGDTATQVVSQVLAADFAVLFVTHDLALADLAGRRYALDDLRVYPR